ncbi:MAG: YdjY domain-containing protein [Planctomycetota bacterium]
MLCGYTILILLAISSSPAGQQAPNHQTASQPTSQPSSIPAGYKAFQPGVWINWQQNTVAIQSHVVLRRGPLEFLACGAGKEHESILRLEASATHIYMALGLIGLTPGHPPQWNERECRYDQPAGDLVDISVQWHSAGQWHSASTFDWLNDLEYARPPIARPWIFAGSLRLADGSLASDHSGVGLALVDFPDSLLALSSGHSSSVGDLWVTANTPAIPPTNTSVLLILRTAQPRVYKVQLDFRGALYVDGRFTRIADFADLLKLARQTDPTYVQVVSVKHTLKSDVQAIRNTLKKFGVPAEAIKFRPTSESPDITVTP